MTLPAGVYARTYDQDQALIRTRPQWYWFVGLLIFIFGLPIVGSGKIIGIVNIMGIMVIAVVGLQITVGYAGQINLGQSTFMGAGAYACAAFSVKFSWPFWLAIPAGGICAALFGAIFGLAAMRIKGFYLALTTIAAQYIFAFAMLKLPTSWFGGAEGLRMEPASIGNFLFNTDIALYYLIFVIAVFMIYGAFGLVRSKTGRSLIAVRDNENAAEVIGINVFYYKILAFLIGAFFAGIAGGLWAYYIRYIQVDQFTLWLSVWYVGMLIVGGMGSILGAIVGTVLIRTLQEMITYIGPQITELFPTLGGQFVFASMNMLLGGVIILFVVFEPRGIVHRWNVIKESFRIWPFPH